MGEPGVSSSGVFDGSLLRRVFARYRALLDEAQGLLSSHEAPRHDVRVAAATLAVEAMLDADDLDDHLRDALSGGRDDMIAALADVAPNMG